jgi:hypothetical protein
VTGRLSFTHEFVKLLPPKLEDGIIYISLEYGTAAHLCACGCGQRVITPITPTDWKVIFDGATVSLYPSIGSWGLPCRSHYWIERNMVEWASEWSEARIQNSRLYDRRAKERFYAEHRREGDEEALRADNAEAKAMLWSTLKKWWPR